MAGRSSGTSAGNREQQVALVLARLAAEERDALEAIKGDLCQWLANPDVLGLDIAPASFLQVLDSGVSLCKLAGLVQEEATRYLASGNKLSVRIPMGPLAYKSIKSPPGSAMFQACARDNASQFIEWCRALGVDEAVIFESVGLVEHRDEKRVILCLLDVARFAEKVGITPPQLVSLEKEIEELESQLFDIAEPAAENSSNKTELNQPEKDVEIKLSSNQPNEEGGQVEDEETTELSKAGEEKVSRKRRRDSDKKTSEEGEEDEAEVIKSPPTKLPKRGPDSGTQSPPPPSKLPTHHKSVQQDKRKQTPTLSPSKRVDEKVMKCIGECTCEHRIQVQNCGNGKYNVMPTPNRKIALYARLLTDRVMVRVGGGWETLEHFLLKHDPCRIENITGLKTSTTRPKTHTAKSTKNGRNKSKFRKPPL